jgi:hypothetical protein
MAVLFDRPATVFDPAPFEPTVRNPVTLGYLQAYLLLNGYSNSTLSDYIGSLGTQFSAREARVSSWYVDGEVLEPLRAIAGTIVGAGQETESTSTPRAMNSTTSYEAITGATCSMAASVMIP